MNQQPQIVELSSKQLVGMWREMSRIDDKTGELWAAFMPRRNEVTNRSTQDYISLQVFPDGPAQLSDPAARFAKWALVEVTDLASVPKGMVSYTLKAGTYAVFQHVGPASDLSTFSYIFTEWLPSSSAYELDDREHFEVLPPDYDARDPKAREQIWIPIRVKQQ
jgi:AraC family transcriptional regulator